MGANVSVESCKSTWDIDVNCTLTGQFNKTSKDWTSLPPYTYLGGVPKGEIAGDPDVAGKLVSCSPSDAGNHSTNGSRRY